MPGLTCNACNKEFINDSDQKLHYKSEWHRYNLKRKVAGVPGVTEALFIARQSALSEEKNKLNEAPMLYSCGLCGKGYRSAKAHAQHLKSKSHLLRASQGENRQLEDSAIVRPLVRRTPVRPPPEGDISEESEESEWEEVDPEEEMVDEAATSLTAMNMDGQPADAADTDIEDGFEELDPTCCFMCDLENPSLETCMVHMHKKHGFFIPDIEYLKDPKGLLKGLKINEKASDEVLEVEKKYNEIRRPVYDKRNEIIQAIPHFWVTAFLSHPALSELVTDEDNQSFKHLTSIEVEDSKDVKSGYSISFVLSRNTHKNNNRGKKKYQKGSRSSCFFSPWESVPNQLNQP